MLKIASVELADASRGEEVAVHKRESGASSQRRSRKESMNSI
jgi:hypothetical protein